MPPIDKREWFDVPDSLVMREDEKGTYHNVEARFADLPVINVEKSRIARHNVYDLSTVLHTRVKRIMGDARAQPNMSAQPIRFDKDKQGQSDFEAIKGMIMRCWDAWRHYQLYREAPITPSEELALHQIELQRNRQAVPGRVTVDIGGELVERRVDDSEDDNSNETEEVVLKRPRGRPPKAIFKAIA